MEEEKARGYVLELETERDKLGSSQGLCKRLIQEEITRVRHAASKRDEPKYLEILANKSIKLSEKVLIPVKEHPKFNFIGKLLGPKGETLKQLQASTGARMAICGRGSMRDKQKEEELRNGAELKYAHLKEQLHVFVMVNAPPKEAYARMAAAIAELQNFLQPDYETNGQSSYMNGEEEEAYALVPAPASHGPPGRGRPVSRQAPHHMARSSSSGHVVAAVALPMSRPVRVVRAPHGAVPGAVPARPHARDAHDVYMAAPAPTHGEYEYEEETYTVSYENTASNPSSSARYYAYGHEEYGPEEWSRAPQAPLKADPPSRVRKGVYRPHPYDRY
ncbi:KH domain-containing, RNA-binding, signal transduction-associated protein 2-like isoform X1 [Petromyzon marinus]|uniref:KH domain-containing, RNA-binding, signal transduction-associated protein 2-like isoform X1 n=1 Tax=Petromyzon marinus TaxID=7757 RepID=UPI003F72D88F